MEWESGDALLGNRDGFWVWVLVGLSSLPLPWGRCCWRCRDLLWRGGGSGFKEAEGGEGEVEAGGLGSRGERPSSVLAGGCSDVPFLTGILLAKTADPLGREAFRCCCCCCSSG